MHIVHIHVARSKTIIIYYEAQKLTDQSLRLGIGKYHCSKSLNLYPQFLQDHIYFGSALVLIILCLLWHKK